MSNSLRPRGLYPTRLLCPWNSPGKNTEVGSHYLCQGILRTQGLNLGASCVTGRFFTIWASLVIQMVKNQPATGDPGSIPGLGRSAGEGKGCPLQYSGLEKSTDCIDQAVTKSRTGLSDFHVHTFTFFTTEAPWKPVCVCVCVCECVRVCVSV